MRWEVFWHSTWAHDPYVSASTASYSMAHYCQAVLRTRRCQVSILRRNCFRSNFRNRSGDGGSSHRRSLSALHENQRWKARVAGRRKLWEGVGAGALCDSSNLSGILYTVSQKSKLVTDAVDASEMSEREEIVYSRLEGISKETTWVVGMLISLGLSSVLTYFGGNRLIRGLSTELSLWQSGRRK